MKNKRPSTIVSLTVNPALDFYTTVEQLKADEKMRGDAPLIEAGGGGVNVSRALAELNTTSVAIFTYGGFTGDGYCKSLRDYGEYIKQCPVAVATDTRESFIVLEESSNKLFRFGMPGGQLTTQEIDALFHAVEQSSPFDILVASGSLAPGMPEDFFVRVARMVHNADAKFILDTSGEALAAVKETGAYLLKPNAKELADLTGSRHESREDQAEALWDLVHTFDIENILLSLGSDGALLATRKKVSYLSPVKVDAKSSVGAGDSTVAGMVYQLGRGREVEDAALFGIACGSAAIKTPGTELFKSADAVHLYKELSSHRDAVRIIRQN